MHHPFALSRQQRPRLVNTLIWLPACVLSVIFIGLVVHSRSESMVAAPVAARPSCARPVTARSPRSVQTAAKMSPASRWKDNVGTGIASLALAGAMSIGLPLQSSASEADVLRADKPTNGYIMDDAPVLQKGSEKKMNEELSFLEVGKGFKLNVVTVRKLDESPDADTLASKMLEKWNPSDASTSGVLVLVGKNSEVAIVGGEKFMSALGEEAAASISQESVGYYANEGRPNFGVAEGVKRISAILGGEQDPGAPAMKEFRKERTYKTKEEVDASRGASIQVVGALLLIAFVVPMLQYAGYVQKD
uniref:Putative thylakoid lumen protein n=1 Tax=Gymnochlora stellata TaxID=67809 RepID=B5A4H7_GYMST|nr:putative thylakoid lumen protein [Gymnochlora stellata]